ncbi:hypothetical protein QJS10_CPA09g01633 [Acorus calamus]|uniref:Uncharacterized protein n=1 Tax=Acorus calamus TaxID=4465 RepID=A0AAV9E4D1_ACOCL|nr:hypothetical protein QJS10_CPA09g01633 [Acorus calamus]
MGLDPKTHSPASPFSAPPTASAAADPSSFPSTRHMAQWESARLEAEARLSRESMLFSFCNNEDYPQPSDPSDKPGVDVFLRIWNSEIGESFRLKKGAFVKVETEESPEPASPASSSSKHGSTVTATTTANAPVFSTVGCEDFECKSSVSGGMMKMVIGGGSDSSCSNELEDSSETPLHLLLNFNGDDEMSGFFAEDVW